jgi:hypothetical protein
VVGIAGRLQEEAFILALPPSPLAPSIFGFPPGGAGELIEKSLLRMTARVAAFAFFRQR